MDNTSLPGVGVSEGVTVGGGANEEDVILRSISPILLGIMSSLALIGVVLAVAFMIFNVRYRQSRLIKMSSPNLNILIGIGAVFIYACVVLFGIDVGVTSSDDVLGILCKVRVSLITLGFTLIYGSMFSKAWRVYRIFAHAATKRMVIRDGRLMTMVGSLLLLDFVVLALWLILDPPNIEQTILTARQDDASSSTLEGVLVCQSKHTEVWMTVLFTVKAFILLLGTHLSWETRNITVPSMNDAKCIVVSVYTCVILVAMVTALMTSLEAWPNAWYCCLSVVMLICPTEMLLLQYIPKIRAWRSNPEASYSMSRSLTTSYLATARQRSLAEVEEELFLLSKENASLKRSLSEKDNTIEVLHEHVGSAKEKLRLLSVDPDMRQDSGCDFDMSSSSTCQEDHDHIGVRPPDVVKDEPRDGDINENERTPEHDPHKLSLKYNVAALERQHLKRRHGREGGSIRSIGSVKSVKEFEDLRESIAHELHQAADLSLNLREAIAHDLHSCRTTPMYMVIADTEKELAGVLKDSYNLDGDNISISSSTFTYDNPVFTRNQKGRRSVDSMCACNSRQSSFRSVADLALEFSERGGRGAPSVSRTLQWPQYRPPQMVDGDRELPRVVKSSETNGSAPKMTKSVYHTYV
ncbi:gamma-aminobutyric acid type B receptor subunit 2-like [Patiria miniata]|uniref:G-protein coupled receptors family 3 profile domain-containing protein n=1 Tax=Patiria miniata TaxID=46514 RepID=A0A914AR60_PATMI|nr:gamma-aminobutyric acid type B receptor subunit 2-like [Patiria miniata]XP_038065923.1 gamma-aminobutyric acid type B receptor subunit 2-like [Patiria miniata]XP_038065924.1 gamma-aminobutyric acid type B receptor subunit 2-like [Patiria miniata]